jgi:hypothetical protein
VATIRELEERIALVRQNIAELIGQASLFECRRRRAGGGTELPARGRACQTYCTPRGAIYAAAGSSVPRIIRRIQAAIARRFSPRSERRSLCRCGGIRRLRAGSFSIGMTTPTSDPSLAERSNISVRISQMLLSIAPVADHAEPLTWVVSRRAVNILRIKRSRSSDGGRSN